MPLIIPIFVIHQGCPHRCSYCSQKKTLGAYPESITETSLHETVNYYLSHSRGIKRPVQIAFYGGSFTGIDKGKQLELLEAAGTFIGQGLVDSIRISTRPDYIDEECLNFLERFSVRTVEIGAQSMVDEVLRLSRRGHSAADVRRAIELLRRRGFETGVHLMAGLPGDSPEGFAASVEEIITLRPDMVRIHPTLVFAGTELAESFSRGDYKALTMAEAVEACKRALCRFTAARIPVIRLGLQTTPEMEKEGNIVAGPFHPSFRALVGEAIFFDKASPLLSGVDVEGGEVAFHLYPSDISSFRGQKNRNIQAIKRLFNLQGLSLTPDPGQRKGALTLVVQGKKWRLAPEDF